MRIVHVSPFFDPATQYGGPISQLRDLCRGLARRGHEISVVSTDLGIGAELPRDTWLDKDGYRIWYATSGRLTGMAPYPAPMIRQPLTEALAGADVAHFSVGLTLCNDLARRVARSAAVPYVYTPHGVFCPTRLRQRRWSKMIFLKLVERRVIRQAAAVQALTDVEKRDLVRQTAQPDRVCVIPNGIDMTDQPAAVGGELFRRKFQLPADVPLVLFLGRLQKIKGLDLLLDTFAEVRRAIPDLHLAVVGPDEDCGARLTRLVQHLGVGDYVRLTGRIDGQMKQSAFDAADVFALTSYSEGLPMSVLEACAAGVPTLLTDQCHVPQVAQYEAGRIEPPDLDRLTSALRDMLGDCEGLRKMSANGRRMIAEKFSLESVVDAIEQLYDRVRQSAGQCD